MAEELDLEHDAKLSLFETIIRAVGGLLSAYDATHDAVFLAKAEALAAKAMPNFLNTGPQRPKTLSPLYPQYQSMCFLECWVRGRAQ